MAVESIPDLVAAGLRDKDAFLATFAGNEDEPAMVGYADYGIQISTGACGTKHGLDDVAAYKSNVLSPVGSAWMDNTTLTTAITLLSDDSSRYLTPLTVWDLATFARAVTCYERIYHHEHPEVDDAAINSLLGTEVLRRVPLPIREVPDGRILPDPWDGAHRMMCDIWFAAEHWIRRLQQAAGRQNLDGRQLEAVTAAWQTALGRNDLRPRDLVNWEDVDRRWRSPSNRLLVDTVKATSVDETRAFLDVSEPYRLVAEARKVAGLPVSQSERLYSLLSDLNLRAYINQRVAEFFELPYVCSAARVPFRDHLYNRSLASQQALTAAEVIDDRYAELSGPVKLRLPVFLAVGLQDAESPSDLWTQLSSIRKTAQPFRDHRVALDQALSRRNLKEARKVARALTVSVDNLLEVAGKAVVSAGTAVVERIAEADAEPLAYGVAAIKAASEPVLASSFRDRLLWRLRRPDLLWINNMVDQSERLTESLPDVSRIWKVPVNQQAEFAGRFKMMANLGS